VTVLRLIRRPEIEQHRTTLCGWLTANGVVDVNHVVDQWLSIEDDNGRTVIRYCAYKIDAEGRCLLDPDDDTRAWTEERTVPLVLDLPPVPRKATPHTPTT
jgi:hypothetical protein